MHENHKQMLIISFKKEESVLFFETEEFYSIDTRRTFVRHSFQENDVEFKNDPAFQEETGLWLMASFFSSQEAPGGHFQRAHVAYIDRTQEQPAFVIDTEIYIPKPWRKNIAQLPFPSISEEALLSDRVFLRTVGEYVLMHTA